uniref:DOMON domain-containing protein n=1 Tax=Poecilia formosa TaxID=48698 RepID=A0A087X9X8_POEFO
MEHKMMQAFATLMVFLALSFQPVLSQKTFQQDVVISKTGCGSTKACVQQPDACDPADNTTTCLFGSARPTKLNPPNGVDLAFEISGNSTGYIAVGLTRSPSQNIMLYVCGQNSSNNGSFFSMSTVSVNGTLNGTLAKAMTDVQNTIAGDNLKCTFNVAGLNATTDAALRAAADTTYKMVITSGQLTGGVFPAVLSFKVGNATDLSTFLNSTTNTTAAPTGGS